MKRQLFVLLFLFLIPFSESEGQLLPFTHYTPDREINALPSAEVHKVFQDKLGYMWFSIYSSGLVRYDGVNMELYGQEDGLRDLTVWDLIEDPSGRLWVSSNAGLVVSEKPLENYGVGKRVQFISESNDVSIIDLTVNHNRMTIDDEGWLWVGTENVGIVKYRFNQEDELQADTVSTNLSGTGEELAVRALTARKDGSIWVALPNGNLLRFKNEEATRTYEFFGDEYTNALFESAEDRLLGGNRDGSVWMLNEDNGKTGFTIIDKSLNSNIASIRADHDNRIWVSSEGSGILTIEGDDYSKTGNITRANGLLSEIVFNITEDREENLWIAQSGGISKLRYNYRAFTNISSTPIGGEKTLLPSPSINTIQLNNSDSNGDPCSFWAGTSEGGIACLSETFDSEYIQFADGLAGNWVNGLAYDSYGRLWIGSTRGLNSLSFKEAPDLENLKDKTSVSVLGKQAELATYPTASILSIQKLRLPLGQESQQTIETLFLPAYHRVFVIIDNTFITLDEEWGLPPTIYHASAVDSLGYLWIGTRDRGIYRSRIPVHAAMFTGESDITDKDTFFQLWWSTEDGAPTNQIDNLYWSNNQMWVGTTNGLISLDAETKSKRHTITTADGLLADNITSIAKSPVTGTFWLGTNQGLAEVDPESGTVLRTITKAEGLVDNEVWYYGSVQISKEGSVYFGTANGISIYKPHLDRENKQPPIVRLTSAVSEEVPGERNEFSFEYAALTFGSEREARYQTRLIGFNDEWSPDKTDTRVNYTNLPAYFFPETYTLEVRAANESGIWSDEVLSYSFTVTPPWWLSWGASMGYFIILALGIFAVDRFQRRRLIKREREAALLRETELKAEAAEAQAKALEVENELKATELEKARELETAYHELKATQKRLIQSEKMASLGRLSTGIAHEIKNPLNFINNFAELSKELVEELREAIANDDTAEIQFITDSLSMNTGKIEEHGKRADAIVKSMMQHSRGSNLNFQMTDLNNIVQKYADLAYHSKSAKIPELDVSIVTKLDENLPEVMIIQQQIGQVLQNIIENAFDAVWEQKLKQNGTYLPKITISTSFEKGEEIKIIISDNGPGIPEPVREKIFEPFFTTKPTGEGTGLGLSISYDIITQIHSGSLKVESDDGRGTRFIITLPVGELSSS
ncbi:hypothetical protein G3570_01695 [Balneolaceae bacterium YR4-1]|uniref:histidine kinase n=1 Tax=Halalkalibaculum roseum TaxID=2709311 RepID=A0A6M1ST94_9BACT|nr:ATP-binding protein [Halalkalibaculum roseum]NGP75328.1 hypothetical protein [Halalkalibaculum roseum]